jgi:hypothetical protein
MKKLFNGTLLFSLAIAPGLANSLALFQGSFAIDNQVALFNITANSPETLTIETDSYAGGTIGGTAVPAGGFAPAAFLFDNAGNEQVLTNGTCGQVGQDPVTMNCDDIFFQDVLGPGTFTLALAVDGNTPVDNFVADGFTEDSDPGFTCVGFSGGSFCDTTTAFGTSRTGNFAIAVIGADSVVNLPEPGSVFLLLAGGALIALRRQSFNSR